jgi:hypothetical protein
MAIVARTRLKRLARTTSARSPSGQPGAPEMFNLFRSAIAQVRRLRGWLRRQIIGDAPECPHGYYWGECWECGNPWENFHG